MTEAVIELGYTPPSLNRAGRSHPIVQHKAKKRLQGELELLLLTTELPRRLMSVEATAVLFFPVARRRDEGNYRWLLEKALGDALVNGGWLPDDTPDRYRFSRVEFSRGDSLTRVRIQAVEDR